MIFQEMEIKNKLAFILLFVLLLAVSVTMIKRFDESLLIISSFIIIILFLLYFYFHKGIEIKEIILYLTVSPLIYLGIYFHYLIFFVILQDILLLILFLYSFYTIKNEKANNIILFEKVLILFFFYILFMFFVGLVKHSKYFAFEEFYHALYYLFTIPLALIFNKEKYYYRFFKFLIFLYLIIATEYLIANLMLSTGRFVSFQAYFLPIIISILFAYLLFVKQNKSRYLITLVTFLIFSLALVITRTRTVWVATFIPMFLIYVQYLIKKKSWSMKRIIVLSIILLSIVFVFFASIEPSKQTEQNTNDIEYRTQSISNPTEDKAFLMRVELGYYTVMKFLESPIWGKGMGDFVKYKFLGIVDKPVYFPDNSWFYFLWKGGLVGFILFLLVFVYAIKTSLFIYMNGSSEESKAIALGITSGLIGMMLLGLLNAILIKYKTTILFPIVFAYLIVEYKRILQKKQGKKE